MALYAAATGPKKLLLVDGADHDDSMITGAASYRRALAELFGLSAKNIAEVGLRGKLPRS